MKQIHRLKAACLVGITYFLTLLLFSCVSTAPEERVAEPVIEDKPEELPPPVLDPYQSISLSIQAGDPAAAIEAYEMAELESPDDPGTRILLAKLYVIAGRIADAEKMLLQIIEDHPDALTAHYNLALIKNAAGDREAAQDLLVRAVRKDPGFADGHAALGEILLERKSLDAAERAFTTAVNLASDNFVARIGLGSTYLRQQRYDESILEFTEAIGIQEDYSFAYVDRALAYVGAARPELAIKDLTTAISLQPDYAFTYLDRGRLYARTNQPELALEDFRRALVLRPDDFYIRAQKADVLYAQGRSAEASDQYVQVLRTRRDYHPAYVPLAVVSFELGNYDRAHRFFDEAYRNDLSRDNLAFAAALSLKIDGKEMEGRNYINQMSRHLPRDGVAGAVARFYQNPGSDHLAVREMQSNQDEFLAAQFNLYMGAQYMLIGAEASAFTFLTRAVETEFTGLPEYRLASILMERL
ncbi:tetratricopeptide repeat protein [Spirochaeta dissipatitropha]